MADPTIFDLYFEYVKDTESPKIYHRWSMVSALSTLLGRNCWLPFGTTRIFPNMYVMLIGNPGTRKSAAIKSVKRVLATTGYDYFSAEKTSKEKFLLDLQGDTSADTTEIVTSIFGSGTGLGSPREVFICADEFNEFVGSSNIEFLSMLGSLWDWDDPDKAYKQRLKTSKSTSIYQPTINILSGNTHAGLTEAFPVQVLGQGFMSRLVLIYSEPSGRKITIPPVPSATLLTRITQEMLTIKARMAGELEFTIDAMSALDTIYKTWPELEDLRFKHYSTRRLTHLLKMCIVCCAVDKSMTVKVPHVFLANTILTYAESHMNKALGELGRKKDSDVSSGIMQILQETRVPLTLVELFKDVSVELSSIADLQKILVNLQQADKIQVVNIPGKMDKGFLPKIKQIDKNKHLYVDYRLLKGAETK